MIGEDMHTRERQRQVAETNRNARRLAAWRARYHAVQKRAALRDFARALAVSGLVLRPQREAEREQERRRVEAERNARRLAAWRARYDAVQERAAQAQERRLRAAS